MSFGSKLKAARIALSLRQNAVATALGVSVQAVSQWERDENYPEFAKMQKICKYFNKPLPYFMDDPDFVAGFNRTLPDFISVPILRRTEVEKFLSLDAPEDSEKNFYERTVGAREVVNSRMFALEVYDNKMVPLLTAGDVAIFATSIQIPAPSDIVAVRADGPNNVLVGSLVYGGLNDSGTPLLRIYDRASEPPIHEFPSSRMSDVLGVMVERHCYRDFQPYLHLYD